MYKLVFYVPDENLEQVKKALFQADAGHIGNYDSCCWQVLGRGQFRPLAGSDPHIGNMDEIEEIVEWKVEMVCEDDLIEQIVHTLKKAHPFETVAYQVFKLVDID